MQETDIQVNTCYIYHNYVHYSSLQVCHWSSLGRNYSPYRLQTKLQIGISSSMTHILLNGKSLCLSFIQSFTLFMKFIETGITSITLGLAKERASLKLGGGLSPYCSNVLFISSPKMLYLQIFMPCFLIRTRKGWMPPLAGYFRQRAWRKDGISSKGSRRILKIGKSIKVLNLL